MLSAPGACRSANSARERTSRSRAPERTSRCASRVETSLAQPPASNRKIHARTTPRAYGRCTRSVELWQVLQSPLDAFAIIGTSLGQPDARAVTG